jgi:hypothetical protein
MLRLFPSLYPVVALSLVLTFGSGCSPIFMIRPPKTDEPIDCTTSVAAPVLDTIVGAAFAAPVILDAARSTCKNCRWETSDKIMIIMNGSFVVASGLAAFLGYRNASHCSKMKSQYTLCLNGDEPSCKALGVLAKRKEERTNTDLPIRANENPPRQPSTSSD